MKEGSAAFPASSRSSTSSPLEIAQGYGLTHQDGKELLLHFTYRHILMGR